MISPRPPVQRPADAGGGIGGVVVVGVLGVVQDLVDILRIGALHEADPGPPFPEIGGNLDHLVFPLGVRLSIDVHGTDLLAEKALVAVVLAVYRSAEEGFSQSQDLLQDLIDMLSPEAAVEIDAAVFWIILAAGEGRVVLPAVGRVDMGDAVAEARRIGAGDRRRIEHGLAGGDVLQLIVGGEEGRRHGRPDPRQLRRGNKASGIAIITMDIRHQGEDIILMPGRAQVNDTASPIPDILQFHILHLRPLAFRLR